MIMKKLALNRIGILSAAMILFSSAAFSQIDNVDFLRSAPADGVKYIEAYMAPWANAFGAGLNGSWYNTAKPHKFGGFDITFGLNLGIVPSSAETFDLSSTGFSTALTGTGKASTIAGPRTDGPTMTYSQSGITLASFPTPPGTGWKYIPVPTLQVGIGLPLGTELKGRFIPRLPIKDGDIMLWGVGLMHSIMQYIPGNDLLPLDVSIFGGFTSLNGNVPISLQPDPAITWNYTTINPTLYFADQNLSMTVQAYNVGAVASVNLKVITFYGGLGYSNTKTTAEMEGNYPAPVAITTGIPHAEYNDTPQSTTTGAEFPNIEIENFSGLRANVGFRLKLAVITIHVDYTRAQYNVVSTGLGISFR
jgi:hypothetical protein